MSFWQNVENELQYKNMSRKELAERASFAVSGISLGISHQSVPSADIAVRIARVLGCSVEFLVTGQDGAAEPPETASEIHHIVTVLRRLDKYDLETVLNLSRRLDEKRAGGQGL